MVEKTRPITPKGPFAPPTPSQVERSDPEPMAVARDKDTPHDAAMPTTARMDQWAPEVAERYRDPLLTRTRRDAEPRSRVENRRAEKPEGFTETDEDGFRHLEDEL